MTDARFPEHMIRKGKELAAKHFASFKLALGAIAIGKEGTLIALEGNPLTDITAVQRVRAVVKAGQVVKHPAPAAR